MNIAQYFNIGYGREKDERDIQMRLYPSSPFPHATLGDCGEIVTGSTPSKSKAEFWGGKVPFVTPAQLGFRDPVTTANEFVTMDGAERGRMLPEGAVLVCCIGSLGKTGVAGVPLITNQQINAIIFDPDQVEARYGYYAARNLTHLLEHFAPSTTLKIVKKSSFAKMEIPLPPLAEQKRIAKILDTTDALRAKRREALAQLDTLLQSTFIDMFGDPVTNPMRWDDTSLLGDIADIVSGLTKGRKLNGKATREVPYLAVVNVQDRHLVLDPLKHIEATEKEIERYQLKNDDLLLTEGGDPDKLGRGTLWHNEVADCIHQNHVFRVRLHVESIHPVYLNWLIGSPRGKRYFLRQAKQTTGIATINLTQLRKFPLIKPPLPLQTQFATIVKSIEQQKARMQAHLSELDTLFAALQQRAFNGDL
ncbi:MAG: restriction endonuclease subunit S [Candidatus Electrothrix communis]|nr:MAG: restriction endonuclease subunit S [Candidatus Electrothrix communis]